MNKLPSEAGPWAKALQEELPATQAEVAVLAPATHLAFLASDLYGSGVAFGAQDLSAHASGAYTGEISAAMLSDLGARYVITGHSERRTMHGESDDTVAAKARAAQGARLVPIVCVGEALEIREAGRHIDVTLTQLRGSLNRVDGDPSQLVIAYEPVWAIGTGRTATAADAEEMAGAIRKTLHELYGEAASAIRVLYGGSVKPDNVREICGQPNVNGALVGGASLELPSVLGMLAALG
ncbi:triose-phosphate isomerase [Deinococcus peraridilitoris]|nr:triose-phosphate isomerase [Deinococcus peraridilitoris]